MTKFSNIDPIAPSLTALRSVLLITSQDLPCGIDTARLLPAESKLSVLSQPADLSPEHIRDLAPDLVLAPLIGPTWDGLDVAIALARAGYRGRLGIVSPRLPRQDLVLREMQALCPALDICLLPLPDGAAK